MKKAKRDDIIDRYYGVLAERSLYPDRKCKQYRQLSQIAKLILKELTIGKHPRYIMYMQGTGYFCFSREWLKHQDVSLPKMTRLEKIINKQEKPQQVGRS